MEQRIDRWFFDQSLEHTLELGLDLVMEKGGWSRGQIGAGAKVGAEG